MVFGGQHEGGATDRLAVFLLLVLQEGLLGLRMLALESSVTAFDLVEPSEKTVLVDFAPIAKVLKMNTHLALALETLGQGDHLHGRLGANHVFFRLDKASSYRWGVLRSSFLARSDGESQCNEKRNEAKNGCRKG